MTDQPSHLTASYALSVQISIAVLFLGNCTVGEVPSVASLSQAVISTSLVAEGDCQWLACCSAYSVAKPVGTSGAFVCPTSRRYNTYKGTSFCDPSLAHNSKGQAWVPSFACGGADSFCNSQTELWLSGPVSSCGGDWVVCSNGEQTHTYIKDHADSHGLWEASDGLIKAVGSGPVHIYSTPSDPGIATDPMCGCKVCCSGGASCGTCPMGQTCDTSLGKCAIGGCVEAVGPANGYSETKQKCQQEEAYLQSVGAIIIKSCYQTAYPWGGCGTEGYWDVKYVNVIGGELHGSRFSWFCLNRLGW